MNYCFIFYFKNAVPAQKWRLLGIRKKSPPQKNGKKEAKIGYARVFARKTHQFFWVIHLHPSIFGSSISTPLSKKIKKIQKYIYFLESEVSPPKFSHTPPLGVFLTPSLSVRLKIIPTYVTLGGGAEEYIFISGLYSPNFLVHSSKSLDNKSL